MVTIVNPWTDVYPDGFQTDADLGGGDYLVETAGYVPKEIQIQQMIDSGDYLDNYYKNVFPNYMSVGVDETEDPVYDPTTAVDYDFFDWHKDVVFVRNQLAYSDLNNNEVKNATTAQFYDSSTVNPAPGSYPPPPTSLPSTPPVDPPYTPPLDVS